MKKLFTTIEDLVIGCQDDESICEQCGSKMTLNIIRKKRNRWDKGHAMYECSCGNGFRKRSVNEILRDLGEEK